MFISRLIIFLLATFVKVELDSTQILKWYNIFFCHFISLSLCGKLIRYKTNGKQNVKHFLDEKGYVPRTNFELEKYCFPQSLLT